ncbi:phage head-tail adapter protein [Trinickia dinghuensis]|uniref:Phage head-tail adapter protein n=2 Tax=Trinickia dinghuensis TaxID=2291023 RepID=A0A3D8K2D8_9BURK|nr:phage head-tail adapter protein [Trinickia dinghuensis]
MSQQALQTALAQAQQAYIDLSTGAKGESYSYSQGEGSRAVTYTRASLPQLTALIQELQAALGMRRRARRPIGFVYP